MIIYGIPNCNSVKKARTWLDDNQINYTFHDFKKLGVDQATVENWLNQHPWEKLVNRTGMTWRNLSESEKAVITDNASAAALMMAKTSVIKRPIMENNNKILCIGFNEDTYKEITK